MALAPHIIKARIDAMPEGEEKDKRERMFYLQAEICGYMLLAMCAGIVGFMGYAVWRAI